MACTQPSGGTGYPFRHPRMGECPAPSRCAGYTHAATRYGAGRCGAAPRGIRRRCPRAADVACVRFSCPAGLGTGDDKAGEILLWTNRRSPPRARPSTMRCFACLPAGFVRLRDAAPSGPTGTDSARRYLAEGHEGPRRASLHGRTTSTRPPGTAAWPVTTAPIKGRRAGMVRVCTGLVRLAALPVSAEAFFIRPAATDIVPVCPESPVCPDVP